MCVEYSDIPELQPRIRAEVIEWPITLVVARAAVGLVDDTIEE